MTESTRDGRIVTLVGVLVNTILILLKVMTGIFGNSQALIADAVHSISDLFTDIAVLIGLQIRLKPPDEKHHFGHARVETLASSFVGIVLIGTALYLGIKSAFNIYSHTESHPTTLALMGAGVSVVLKEVLYQYTVRTGRRINSRLLVANATAGCLWPTRGITVQMPCPRWLFWSASQELKYSRRGISSTPSQHFWSPFLS